MGSSPHNVCISASMDVTTPAAANCHPVIPTQTAANAPANGQRSFISGRLACGPAKPIAPTNLRDSGSSSRSVAHLVLNGADPRRILLLTFTRRAGADMTRRAALILGELVIWKSWSRSHRDIRRVSVFSRSSHLTLPRLPVPKPERHCLTKTTSFCRLSILLKDKNGMWFTF